MKVKIPENEYQLMDMLADYVLGYDTNDVITIRSADLLSALQQARSKKAKKWTVHDGTPDCPIAPDTIVRVKTGMWEYTARDAAGYLSWELIEKYRVIKQPENKE